MGRFDLHSPSMVCPFLFPLGLSQVTGWEDFHTCTWAFCPYLQAPFNPPSQTAPPEPPRSLRACTLTHFSGRQTWEEAPAGSRASPQPAGQRIWGSRASRASPRAGGRVLGGHVPLVMGCGWKVVRVHPLKNGTPRQGPYCLGQRTAPVLFYPQTLHDQAGSGHKQQH